MQALVYDGTGAILSDRPDPRPGRGEALLAVRMAGVCRTDLEILDGYMNFRGVMGHEFVATALTGPADWRGRRVTAEINCPCRLCRLCRMGLGGHCPTRTVLGIAGRDGVFAERVAVPVANLHAVPDSVSDDQAVFIEPLAAAVQIFRQVALTGRDNVVLLGDGRLAQLVARVLKVKLGRALMVGRHAERLAVAARVGVQTVLATDFAPTAQADVVIDATGTPEGFELAMQAVRPRGTIVLKSTFAGGKALNLAPLVINEVTVVGSRCGPFDEAIALLASGQIEVASLITARFPLVRAMEALLAAKNRENLKVVIEMG
ncbi:MAG: alcohol dehydrogenase catalytic domain-containing protein [Planctomycetota bacterium]|nr:alcohol dehydrogenase catalytic domain-containing protein [Planctomycetota bacterium]